MGCWMWDVDGVACRMWYASVVGLGMWDADVHQLCGVWDVGQTSFGMWARMWDVGCRRHGM